MNETNPTKQEKWRAREVVGRYHEQEQAVLIGRVRAAIERHDCGELTVFEVDDLIHQYHRASQKLWAYCNRPNPVTLARIIEENPLGDEPADWWEAAAPRRDE